MDARRMIETFTASVALKDRLETRRLIRRYRNHFPRQQRAMAAHSLARRVAISKPFMKARRLALYWPADGEIDPLPLAARAFTLGKRVYLPLLPVKPSNRMRFGELTADSSLFANRYGIPEPRVKVRDQLRADQLDLLLMPVVAMDRAGNRIGMGAGYYDRALQPCLNSAWRPQLMGVGYHWQLLGCIEAARWDAPLDWWATDSEVNSTRLHR